MLKDLPKNSLLRAIESVGNKIPHPFMFFIWLSLLVLVLSWFLSGLGIEVDYSAAARNGGGSNETSAVVVNLLTKDTLADILKNFVRIYINSGPLATVMVFMMVIGFLQNTGFFDALIRHLFTNIRPAMITFVLAVVSLSANLASTAGTTLSAILGAALFASAGRNPLVGTIVGYVAASAGFSVNLLIAGTDVLLSSITESAVKAAQIDFITSPLMNWFFFAVGTLFLAVITVFITEKILPRYLPTVQCYKKRESELHTNSAVEKRGLKVALWCFLAYLVLILLLSLPHNAPLRNAEGALFPVSPLTQGVAAFLFLLFFIVALAYGYTAKSVRDVKTMVEFLARGLQDSLSYFVVILPASMFIYLFSKSNLGVILSVKGGQWLQDLNFTGLPLLISFILLTAFVNLFLSSGSSKWLIFAPIFVPLFAATNISPALAQVAYRIGDTTTNPITPINSFLPMLIVIVGKYLPKEDTDRIGLGTIISLSIPYSMAYLFWLILQLVIWYLLDWSLGPAAPLFFN